LAASPQPQFVNGLVGDRTGARWEVTVDGRPRTYDRNRDLAIEAAEFLKLKNPAVDVTVRDLEGVLLFSGRKPRIGISKQTVWRLVTRRPRIIE
jgi:hypothetical protein